MIVDWRETEYQTNMHSRLFVNVAVVESKGWLFHVAVDPLFACIKFEHIAHLGAAPWRILFNVLDMNQ